MMLRHDEERRSHLPISTHTRVLGVDIYVHQRDNGPTELRAYGSDDEHVEDVQSRKYLAAWARRTLFSIEGSHAE